MFNSNSPLKHNFFSKKLNIVKKVILDFLFARKFTNLRSFTYKSYFSLASYQHLQYFE